MADQGKVQKQGRQLWLIIVSIVAIAVFLILIWGLLAFLWKASALLLGHPLPVLALGFVIGAIATYILSRA